MTPCELPELPPSDTSLLDLVLGALDETGDLTDLILGTGEGDNTNELARARAQEAAIAAESRRLDRALTKAERQAVLARLAEAQRAAAQRAAAARQRMNQHRPGGGGQPGHGHH